jgi:chitinase
MLGYNKIKGLGAGEAVRVKDVEKEGQAEFKIFSKEHTLSMDKPTATKESRPPESSHSTAKTSSCGNSAKRADNGNYCDPQFNKVVTTAIVDDFDAVRNPVRGILCNAFGQACYNYRSIANFPDFATLTCGYRRLAGTVRPISKIYSSEHKTSLWDKLITNLPEGGCSPDEFPPAVMADINDGYNFLTSTTSMVARSFQDRGQRLRYLASVSNHKAGNLFNKCGNGPVRTLDNPVESITKNGRRGIETTYTKYRAVFTRKLFTMDFAGLDTPTDDGIPENECAPTVNGVKHPGYALLNTDGWSNANPGEFALVGEYANSPPTKRDWIEGRGLVMIGGNSSRVATPEELRREFGFDACSDDVCSRELEALKAITGAVREVVSPTRPVPVVAEATSVSETVIARGEPILSLPGSNSMDPHFPVETGSAASMPKKFPTRKARQSIQL